MKHSLRTLLELLARLVVRRLIWPRPLYPRLAVISFLIFGAAIPGSLLEVVLDWYGPRNSDAKFVSEWLWVGPLTLGFFFLFLHHRYPVRGLPEPLVHTPIVGAPTPIGASKVRSYCGSVEMISNVDVIVTSENHDLRLASFGGTSVSARMRRLAATYDESGKVISDNLSAFITNWKSARGEAVFYPLATCVPAPPFNAARLGVKCIILAVTLELRNTGQNFIDEHKIRDVCRFAVDHCHANGYSSVFIPTFGIGGGRMPAEHIEATLNPLIHLLEHDPRTLHVYIGTYRASDAVVVEARLARYR
jgi:hypothetical protein